MAYSEVPSNYNYLKQLRQNKKVTLKPCSYIKESTKLRNYQAIGSLHLVLLSRMVLGDSPGLGKCIGSDSLIPTNKGLIRLSELFPQEVKDDTYYPLPEDLLVETFDGWKKPSALYYCGVRDGLEIKTRKGFILQGLGHHPIYATTDKGYDFKRLDALEIGSYACIQRELKFPTEKILLNYNQIKEGARKNYRIPKILDEDLAEILGFYVSEGCSSTKRAFTISQYNSDGINGYIRDLLKKVFGYEQSKKNQLFNKEIHIPSMELHEFFSSLGVDMQTKSGDQIVPWSILKSPKSVVRAFLRAYFEGDGSAESSNNIVSCSSKSGVHIEQIQQMLLYFGIVARRKIKLVKVNEGRQPYHILYFCGQDTGLFEKEIGFISERKNEALKIVTNKKRNTNLDVIPFGGKMLREALNDVMIELKKRKLFWITIAGKSVKRQVDRIMYHKKKGVRLLTYELFGKFLSVIEKNDLCENVALYPFMKDLYDRKIYFDRIDSITPCRAEFADLCIPEGHNFVGNGFINHNTACAIAAYSILLQNDPSLKLLVVTPKSAMEQWAEEFEKFSQGITTHVLSNAYGQIVGQDKYGHVEVLKKTASKIKTYRGFEARKIQYDTVQANVLIVNYNTIQDDYNFLIQNRSPNFMLILDEIQECKNHKTKTHFGANEISQKAKRVYGLSATIIKNRLEEAYNIYNIVVPGLFGGRNKFLQTYTIRKKMVLFRKGKKRYFNKITGYTNLAEFKKLLDPYFLIRRTREVANELPRLISKKVLLEMGEQQSLLYKKALSGELYQKIIKEKYFKMQAMINGSMCPEDSLVKKFEAIKTAYEESLTKEGRIKNKIAALAYCQLVSNGPALVNEPGESSKEIEFKRLFEQELFEEKVIIFTRFKSGIPRLEKILDELECKHVRITGDEDSQARNVSKKAFQDTEQGVNVIFITYAGSAAINLQAANVILFYDTPWSYGDLYQTIGRAQRIGSIYEHIYLMHMINAKTIDEHVIEILESKKDLITNIMGDIAEGAIEFKEEDLLFKDEESGIGALYSSVFGN